MLVTIMLVALLGSSEMTVANDLPPETIVLKEPASEVGLNTHFPGFNWSEHPKAFRNPGEVIEYEIQIGSDKAFVGLVDHDRVALNRYIHDRPLSPGTYHWRVRAIQPDGKPLAWSKSSQFTIKKPDFVVTVDVEKGLVHGVNSAVAKAKEAVGKSVRIVVPPGDYVVDSNLHGYLFDLEGCKDLIIDGTGANLSFSSRKQGLIRARDCHGIEVVGFDVSYAKGSLRMQGRVVSLDPATRRVTVRAEPGYPGFEGSDNHAADIMFLLEPRKEGRLKSGVRSFFRPSGEYRKIGDGMWSFTIDKDFEKWEVGDRFVCNFRSGSMHLFDCSRSHGVTAYDLTVAGWGGMQFVSVDGNDFRILNCTSRFDDGKWMTGNADGVHIRGHRLGPWIEGLEVKAIGDDSIALYARPSSIQRAVVDGNPKAAFLRPEYFNLEEGDEVSFFQPTEGLILLETKVVRTKPRDDGFVLVTFADDLPLSIRTTGPLVEQTQIWNRSKSCGDFMVRGCEFTNIRRYGTVFRSKRGVVENNTYRGISNRAIVAINGTQWPNGLYASEIIIRNNAISDSCFDSPNRPAAIGIIFNGYKRGASSIGPRNILIEGNAFTDCPIPEIFLSWTRNAVIRTNIVKTVTGQGGSAELNAKSSENIMHAN